MRSSVVKILALLTVFGTASGAAAEATATNVQVDPTHRPSPRRLAPRSPDADASATNPDVGPSGSPWTQRIDARLEALSHRHRPTKSSVEPNPELTEALRDIAASAGPRAQVGIAVRDLSSGASLFDLDADALLNPASNLKLVTAIAATELLGPDFRFETRIARAGDALVLIGAGDPSLQIEDLTRMVRALPPEVLRGVERIVVDDSAFSERRFGPGYDEAGPGFSYEAPSGALSLQFNTVEIAVRPGAVGQSPSVAVRPACDHINVHSVAHTGRGRPLSITTHRRGDHTEVAVRGAIRPGAEAVRIRRRITDPGLFAGTTFARMLARERGGTPLPVQRGTVPSDAEIVHVHRSAPLVQVLGSALKFSNNFTTEQVLRTLGHLYSDAAGDWHNGQDVVRRFWAAVGLPEEDLVFVNASGLGRTGRITPRALVTLLELVADPEHDAAAVVSAMPVAGREGTLASRLRRTRGRVRAKTGTLTGASGLTGVISDDSGSPRMAFSILVNGRVGTRRARRLQDRVVRALVGRP